MIEDIISIIVNKVSLSTGVDLRGFVIDTKAYLSDEEFFDNVEVRGTTESTCMVEAKATVNLDKKHSGVGAVLGALLRVWNEISYEDLALTSVIRGKKTLILRFITASIDAGLCVTGRIIVEGDTYERIALEA